jgi:WD40 repeat protein
MLLPCLSSLSFSAGEPGKKLPVPDKAAQAKSLALVLDIFKDDLAEAKKAEAKSKLAAFLLQQGKESKDDAANRFVLYREARDLAAQAGDAALALLAIEELGRDFDVNPLDMKAQTLAVVAANVPSEESAKSLVDMLMPFINDAVEADDYDTALALTKVADVAARKSKIVPLVVAVSKREAEVRVVQKGFARLQAFVDRLKKNPKDAEANLELGKYHALLKGRWERALPLLAKGNDDTLQKLAGQDLENPEGGAQQLALADGWWELAAAEKDPAKLSLQRRAMHWYEKALVNLAGLNRTKALKRIDLIAARLAGVTTESPSGPVGELKKFEGHTDEVKSVALSGDGRYAVSGGIDQTVRVWDLATGKEYKVLRGHTKQVWSVAFHPNGRQVFSASWDASARLWDITTGADVKRFNHRLDLNGLAVSRDGGKLLTACDDQNAYLWDVLKNEEVRRFPGHTGFVYSVAFAPDGRHIASGSVDKTVRVHDIVSGTDVKVFKDQNNAVTNVAFSGDSRFVLSSGDSVIHMWEISTGKEVRRFEGHSGAVAGMAISPDGRRLLTGGDDKSIRLWDVNTGKELHQFKAAHTDAVTCVAFSSDGRRAVSGSLDRTVRLWGLPAR